MRLLDLYCGAGGAAVGYHRAGWEVVGVDCHEQPTYPYAFIQGDALTTLDGLAGEFDAIHASPPCQAYTCLRSAWNARSHPRLIEPTRNALLRTGLPYVIESVRGAPLLDPVILCGAAFGLGYGGWDLARHRSFETNWPVGRVPPCRHRPHRTLTIAGDHVHTRRRGQRVGAGQASRTHKRTVASIAMGIDWMDWAHLKEAIPPAYTHLLGSRLAAHLG